MKGSREGVEEAPLDGDAHYGVNTSFGAVQLPDILDNVEQGLAIEPLTAAQALGYRLPLHNRDEWGRLPVSGSVGPSRTGRRLPLQK